MFLISKDSKTLESLPRTRSQKQRGELMTSNTIMKIFRLVTAQRLSPLFTLHFGDKK